VQHRPQPSPRVADAVGSRVGGCHDRVYRSPRHPVLFDSDDEL
jgi:hypothetical protein